MSREILFRGKTAKGKWIEGYFCPCSFGRFPCTPAIIGKEKMDRGCWEADIVDPETVGQYTGLTDINGKKIFEGDICLCDRNINDHIDKRKYIIEFESWRGWIGTSANGWSEFYGSSFECAEVIGNIHDNPELLK